LIDASESVIRLSIFIGVFMLMTALEFFLPRVKAKATCKNRWFDNLSLMLLSAFFVRLLLPLSATVVAAYVEGHHIGLLQVISMPYWLQVVLAVLILDMVIYTQHRLFHQVSFLWRFHKVHHTDKEVDVTTAVRFHPLEIFISTLIKIVAIVILGAPALAVLLFEIILSSMALFNHSNVYLAKGLDKWLRFIVVTPDMHRIHHSIIVRETNSNYGFSLSIWDRLFASYTLKPSKKYTHMQLGLKNYNKIDLNLTALFLLPLRVRGNKIK
jgi:sterol desaturase/sphingolipid hydroxylase (fatty acid hydroxylase superfamily)